MQEVLLSTKLKIPPGRKNLVFRPRLHEQLNAGLEGKVILVAAPAGYGKTTLLSEWVQGRMKAEGGRREDDSRKKEGQDLHDLQPSSFSLSPSKFAWLILDEEDNDVARFLAYFVAALQTIEPGICQAVTAMLQPPQPAPVPSILSYLINELAGLEGDFVIVLDDYHLIKTQPIHDALIFLVERMPAPMHLVISTRADPPLPLARLRARGQLFELRAADLCFSVQEVREFLNDASGLSLSSQEIDALAARTEGWISGLQLAAYALKSLSRHGPDIEGIHRLVGDFTGSNRHILDFLLEEVFERQPEDIRTFLLYTSILDRLSGPLCDFVLGERGIGEKGIFSPDPQPPSPLLSSQKALEYLDHHNLFIVSLDEERRWYRYHRLFDDLLRQRLAQAQPKIIPSLHRRASVWYEQNGLAAEAIDHALSAGDFERAAHLLEEIARTTLMRGEVITLLRWLEKLPEELLRSRPSLCIYSAWALLLAGRSPDAVKSRLQDARIGTTLSAEATVFRAIIATLLGDPNRSLELSRQALELLPEHDLFLHSILASNLGMAYVLKGDIEAATLNFEKAIEIGQKAGNTLFAVGALCNLAGLCQVRGQLRRAKEIYLRALGLAADERGRRLPMAARALLGLGELAREWNDLEAARRDLSESLELFKQSGEIGTLVSYLHLARVMQAAGDSDGANEMIQNARRIASNTAALQLDDRLVEVTQARLWIQQGNLEACLRWTKQRRLEQRTSPGMLAIADDKALSSYDLREAEYFVLARVWIAQGRHIDALEVLKLLKQTAEVQGRTRRLVEGLVLEALAISQISSGEQEPAGAGSGLDALKRALSLAEPEGYVRIFLDEGELLARLLRQLTAQDFAEGLYARRLLNAFEREKQRDLITGTSHPGPASRSPQQVLIEPLSERELEVLRLIADGLTNGEIAGRLVISLSTVKGHTANIFSKLGVHHRAQAAARARELGLLS